MTRPWNFVDFVLVVLGGFVGAFVAAAVTLVVDDTDTTFLVSLLGQYLGHILVIWLLARQPGREELGLSVLGSDLLYVPLGALTQIVLALAFAPLANRLLGDTDTAQEIGEVIDSVESTTVLIAVVVITVVLAPLVEEITFRGVLLRSLKTYSTWVGIVVSSLVFAAFHMIGLDPATFWESAAVVLPQLFMVGALLAWVTLRNGRLGPAIMLHSGFNLVAAIAILAG